MSGNFLQLAIIKLILIKRYGNKLKTSVVDPDPDVFGPPGSGYGSISTRYGSIHTRYGSGSGSGSFYHQSKIIRKTFIPPVLRLLHDFLSLKNDVTVASKGNKQKNKVK
jgi:hypothetical protein